jgi:rubrerythrin
MEDKAMRGCKASSRMLVVGMLVVLTLISCFKKTEDATSTKKYATLANPQTAYAAEVRHFRWYTRFIQQAKEDRLVNAAALFNAVAQSEQTNASNQAREIRTMGSDPKEERVDSVPLGVTRHLLKLALSSDQFECESLYPMMIQTVEVEKLAEVAKEFARTKHADACQWKLFTDAVTNSGNIPPAQYRVCSSCGFVVTSDTTEQCPICSTTREV